MMPSPVNFIPRDIVKTYKGAGEAGKRKPGEMPHISTCFYLHLEAYCMYPYGGNRFGYQGSPVCDGTR